MPEIINPTPLVVPPAGESFADPAFGTVIKRITASVPPRWTGVEYSSVDPWNVQRTRFVLLNVDRFHLYGSSGFIRELPIAASSQPRWSRTVGNLLYFHEGNELKVWVDAGEGAVHSIHAFSEFDQIDGLGEGDLNENHLVLCGTKDGRKFVFVYNVVTGQVYPSREIAEPFESIYVVGNFLTVTFNRNGTKPDQPGEGIWAYDLSMNPLRQVALAGGHMDVTRDADGSEVLIWANAGAGDYPEGCVNGITKISLRDGWKTCLLSLGWSKTEPPAHLAVHVSCPDKAGFAIVETYAPHLQAGADGWMPYTNEILKVPLNGSTPTRLCHHRSNVTSYTAQPKSSVRRDGTVILFASNMADPDGPGCDVYQINLPSAPAPPTIPSVPGGSRTHGRKRVKT